MKVLTTESEKKNISTIIYITIACLFLALLISATIYSQTLYVSRLPLVDVYIVEDGNIDYAYNTVGIMDNGNLIVTLDLNANFKDIFLVSAVTPGSKVSFLSDEHESGGIVSKLAPIPGNDMMFLIEITPDNPIFQDGESVNVTIFCENIRIDAPIVPSNALVKAGTSQYNIFLLNVADGPWGQRTIAVEQLWVDPWPEDENAEYVFLIGAEIDKPVILGTDSGILFDGMEVRTPSGFSFDFESASLSKKPKQNEWQNDTQEDDTSTAIGYPVKQGLSGTLRISCAFGTVTSVLAEGFMKLYPDVNIIVETTDPRCPIAIAGFAGQIRTQLMSGEDAPDIVNVAFTIDFIKAAENGMLIDLYTFWNNDPDIIQDDYFTNIIELYEFDDALYAIPTIYFLNISRINKRVTEPLGIDVDGITEISASDVLDIYLKALDEGIIGDNFKLVYGDPGKEIFFDHVAPDYFDRNNGVAKFDSPEFIEFLEKSNQIPTRQTVFSGYTIGAGFSAFEDANNAFTKSDWSAFTRIAGLSRTSQYTSQGVLMLSPDGYYSMTPSGAYAITGTCKNPELAWEFIKYCIMESETAPYSENLGEWNGDRWYGFNPINRNNLHKYMISTMERVTGHGFIFEDYLWLLELIERVDGLIQYEALHNEMNVFDILTLYFDMGLITAEECARQLQERAEIYFGE